MAELWEQVQELALDPKRVCWAAVQYSHVNSTTNVPMRCGRVASWWYARESPLSTNVITCRRCRELGHPQPSRTP